MLLNEIYKIYTKSGYSSAKEISVSKPKEYFYLALMAYSENNFVDALKFAQCAIDNNTENIVFIQGYQYLKALISSKKNGAYIDDKGFEAFINNGSNILLYNETVSALREVYLQYRQMFSLFDVGAGDGRALLPALTRNIKHLGFLEPAKGMYDRLYSKLESINSFHFESHCDTFQNFIKKNKASNSNWDVVQATYSFQSLSLSERLDSFKWLNKHSGRVIITEFDVPKFESMFHPDRYKYIIKRYRKGLREYSVYRNIVAQGFLMPVMFGYFDKSLNRVNYEQPISDWVGDLNQSGFKKVKTKLLYNYWWASAYMIDAST